MQITDIPHSERLDGSIAYFYRLREWLGDGYDMLMWWKSQDGKCHYFQSVMGETIEPNAKIIADRDIDSKVFDELLKKLKCNGIMELQIDENPKIMNNYVDSYFVLLEGDKFHSFQLLCGYHSDCRFKKIQNIIYRHQ